jgi:hypothetical protein
MGPSAPPADADHRRPLACVDVAQEEFLHPKFLTDTLGYDEPETKCKFPN